MGASDFVNFTVDAKLTVAPTSGNAGTTATLTGSGFTAAQTINGATGVTFGGAAVTLNGTQTVASNGSWTATFMVPTGSGAKTIIATDSANITASASFTISTGGPPPPPPLAIQGGDFLPDDQVNVAYPSTTVTAQNGTVPYRWSATGMPPGLTINTSTGVVSGTPTTIGSYTPTVTVTDAVSATATQNYTIAITSGPTTLTIKTASPLSGATTGTVYTLTLSGTGGTLPYTWAVQSGALPPGLTLSSGGVISGTPTASGTYTPTIAVTDSAAAVATKALSITVSPTGPVTTVGGVRRWLFTDPFDSSQYVFEINPIADARPQFKKNLQKIGTTAPNGVMILFEGRDAPPQFNWNGTTLTQSSYYAAMTWFSKRHVLTVTDDQGTAWNICIIEFNPKRIRTNPAHPWKMTYEVKSLLISSTAAPPPPPPRATLLVAPTNAVVGTTGVTLSGTGYHPALRVNVTFGATTLTVNPASPLVASDGTWSATFTVPNQAAGAYSITARDTGGTAASATFTIGAAPPPATLSVAPTSALAGTAGVILSGTGYQPAQTVNVNFGGVALTVNPQSPVVASNGSWSATFTVPNQTAGPYLITATDTGGGTASVTFTVSAAAGTFIVSENGTFITDENGTLLVVT